MSAPSLKWRLLFGTALGIILALVAVAVVVVQSFALSLERERVNALDVTLKWLMAQVDPNADEALAADLPSGPRYDTPLSGFYWQVEDLSQGRTYRSRSLWDGELEIDPAAAAEGRLQQSPGPDGKPLIVLSRLVQVASAGGMRDYRLSVAEMREDVDHPRQLFSNDLFIALAVAAVFLFGAAWLQVSLILRPLDKLRADIEAIKQGRTDTLRADHASEFRPVTRALTDLLHSQESSLAFARQRASDLAHGLKTPLAVLAATAERLMAGGQRAEADIIRMLGEEMNERIQYQLKLSRLRIRSQSQGVHSPLNDAVLRSVSVLRKTDQGENLNWRVDLAESIEVDVDEHDLMEMIGALLENACKWAITRVDVVATKSADMAKLRVDDDGTGLTDEQIASLGERGKRLDQSRPGEGLGLAIVFEIVRLNNGQLDLARSALGGLQVELQLPLAGLRDAQRSPS